jgi:NADH-quinone oxidoreductase subunit C
VSPEDLVTALRERFEDVLLARGEVTVVLAPGDVAAGLSWLGEQPTLSFDFLSCVSAADGPGTDPRFWVTYELRSLQHHHRVRVKTGVAGEEPRLPSVTPAFPTANWQEREIFDLFGVVFEGHPNLRRILLPEDWDGHPLRKDEELGGVHTWFHGARVPPVDERGMA